MKFPKNKTLETSRCRLRYISKDDIPHIFEAAQYPGFTGGMTMIRHIPKGFQKNGKWIEENMLGITRDEWERISTARLSQGSSAGTP